MRFAQLLMLGLALLAPQKGEGAPARLLAEHPLAETIWHTGEGQAVARERLVQDAVEARFLLLGEKHDNARHHALQALLLARLAEAGRRPAVVWEMIEPRFAGSLSGAQLQNLPALGDALEWEERGWPDWPEYSGIAGVALFYRLPLADGAPPRSLVRGLVKGEPLPDEAAKRIGWSRGYSPAQADELREQLVQSHCGALPESALPKMSDIQRLRDAWMAARLREADGGDGSVLIAGGQHVRKDRAVPWLLEAPSLSIAFIEVARGLETPEDYSAFDPALFDYVWFTARVDEEDPCAAFHTPSNG